MVSVPCITDTDPIPIPLVSALIPIPLVSALIPILVSVSVHLYLLYWKRNQGNLPHLTKLALHYLCAPPASVASERLLAQQVTYVLNSVTILHQPKLSYLIFLNKNLQLLDYDY